MHLRRGALEELDVALAHGLSVLLEGLAGLLFTREQHESISRGAAIGVVDEEDTFLTVQDLTRVGLSAEEFQLSWTGKKHQLYRQ